MHVTRLRPSLPVMALMLTATVAQAQKITTPKEQFGFNVGDDYRLANYAQLQDYWAKLDKESDRMKVVRIGTTAEGRPMLMAIITSPENQAKLERYRTIAKQLAVAEGITEAQAHALAGEGKSVVWIDGGLHASEVLGSQQLLETVYQLVSRTDPETMRFLKDDIVLCTLVNPDGMDLEANWYMRSADTLKRSLAGVPRLYQKYIGHDNNRDFYISNQPETEAVNKVLYLEWFPQIVYNHHQTGPAGTVMFAPPFRDPFNYNVDPMVVSGIDQVGSAMMTRFLAEDKPGVTVRSGSSYSTWWNGGLRTTVYFHNMIGLLTETIGNPTPIDIPLVPANQLPRADLPMPIAPQKWHFRQSIDYSITANRAVLDIASRNRETLLYNIYKMGRNSIERGSQDTWTASPKHIDSLQALASRDRAANDATAGGGRGAGFGGGVPAKYFAEVLRTSEGRDPRGYILPSDQPDFPTATKFIDALQKVGIQIHYATAPFTVKGKQYPAGSYVVKMAQSFRPHILDMFEPQDHPNDIPYPGAPPKAPYDNAGYTLAYQMGVQFDRILDPFDGPLQKIEGMAKAPAGKIAQVPSAKGYFLSHAVNDAFIAINRLMKSNADVFWLEQPFTSNGKTYPAGTIYIPAAASAMPIMQKAAAELGLTFEGTAITPTGQALKLHPVRVALWDVYGGSMPSGWQRWLLERFEFPFEVAYAPTFDAGNLKSKYDVIIFPDGGIPSGEGGRGGRGGGGGRGGPNAEDIPAEFRGRLGAVSVEKTVPQLKQFLEDGGTILTVGSSTALGYHLGLPLKNALVEKMADGSEKPLPREKYYVPGSVLDAKVDNTSPLAYGIGDRVDVFFDNSPLFRLGDASTASPGGTGGASGAGIRKVAWFDSPTPLRSGWAWGEKYLDQGVAVADASVGKGHLFLFGPEITFRGQPHGTFKFLFNGIYYGAATPTQLPGGPVP